MAKGYLQGANGVVKSWDPIYGQMYYYQDKLGSTTHVANVSGALLESYHYDLYGTPAETSTHGIVDLYAGERWIPELGLYDLRNRFISPELGRFLQPDPIGFKGDPSNLYRYVGNNPIDKTDPMGLLETDSAGRYSTLTCLGGGDWIKDSNGMSAWDFNQRGINTTGIDPSVIRFNDTGNTNLHEPRVKNAKGMEVNALTQPSVNVTREDGALVANYNVDVRYSDRVGPNNKEMQKKEPEHKKEIDADFRHGRGPEIMKQLTRSGGPLEGKPPETARQMTERMLQKALDGAYQRSHDKHDLWNPITRAHGDHILVHPDGLDY